MSSYWRHYIMLPTGWQRMEDPQFAIFKLTCPYFVIFTIGHLWKRKLSSNRPSIMYFTNAKLRCMIYSRNQKSTEVTYARLL